jgi:hypothetical protein
MRLLFLVLLWCSFQCRAQTFDIPELLPLLTSGTNESVKEFFLKKGLSLIPVDKVKGTVKASAMYSPMGPEHWFDRNGEQILFEFESESERVYVAASFDWDPQKKQIDNISMLRARCDSLVFEKQMEALGMINAIRERSVFIFITQDYEIAVFRQPDGPLNSNSEILMIVRRDSKMWSQLPPLPKKFNKKKK